MSDEFKCICGMSEFGCRGHKDADGQISCPERDPFVRGMLRAAEISDKYAAECRVEANRCKHQPNIRYYELRALGAEHSALAIRAEAGEQGEGE